jgi:thiol-disulfide isomerase/thioredoxin
VFLVLLLGACLGVLTAQGGERQRIEGVDLDGKRVNPLKAGSGKPVVLVFVRTDCPISNRYAPTVQRLQTEYAGRAVLWLVYPDNDETAEQIRKHLQEYGYTLPVLRDPDHELVRISRAEITPEAAVFGARGELAYHGRIDNLYESVGRARNAASTHELSDALQAAVDGKTPKVSTAPAVGCSIMDMR